MSKDPTDLPKSIGGYEILEFRDRTSRTHIYKAKDPNGDRFLTVEIATFDADPETAVRFREEAEKLKALTNPHLPKIHEVGADGARVFVVTEFNGFQTLENYLKSNRPNLRDSISITRAIASATQAAHSQDVLHLHLTPKHIRVSSDLDTIKVRGFLFGETASKTKYSDATVTLTHNAGEMFYVAPEQDAGGDLGTWTDVYGLGVLLYETLTGSLPIGSFALPSRNSSTIPPEIDQIILRCLAKRPTERYRSVKALIDDLDNLADRQRLHLAQDLEGLGKQTSKLLSNTGVLAAIGAVAIAAAVGGYFFLRGGADPASAPTSTTGETAAVETTQPSMTPTTNGTANGKEPIDGSAPSDRPTSASAPLPPETPPSGTVQPLSQPAAAEGNARSGPKTETAAADTTARTTQAQPPGPAKAEVADPVPPPVQATTTPQTQPETRSAPAAAAKSPARISESEGIFTDTSSLISWYGPRVLETAKEAEDYATTLSHAGVSGWHVPSNLEMQQICTAVNDDPKVDLPRYIWTSDRRGTPLRRKNALYDCRGNHVEGYFSGSEIKDKIRAGLRPYALPVRDVD